MCLSIGKSAQAAAEGMDSIVLRVSNPRDKACRRRGYHARSSATMLTTRAGAHASRRRIHASRPGPSPISCSKRGYPSRQAQHQPNEQGLTIGLIDAAKNDVGEVREETMRVEDRLDHAGDRLDRHRLGVGMSVPLGAQRNEETSRRSVRLGNEEPAAVWQVEASTPGDTTTHLKSLLNPFDERVSVRGETIDSNDSCVRPGKPNEGKKGGRQHHATAYVDQRRRRRSLAVEQRRLGRG